MEKPNNVPARKIVGEKCFPEDSKITFSDFILVLAYNETGESLDDSSSILLLLAPYTLQLDAKRNQLFPIVLCMFIFSHTHRYFIIIIDWIFP